MIFKFNKNVRRDRRNFRTGFTLVELLVVFFIMATILAVIVPDYLTYSTKIELENLALDVALTMREAQAYGAGAKVSTGGDFNTSFGVHFVKGESTFIFFENTSDGNGNYDVYSPADNIIATYTIKNGYTIDDICDSSDPSLCDENETSPSLNVLDVVFKRPNPAAIIKTAPEPQTLVSGFSGWQATGDIVFISPDRKRIYVRIQNTGNIAIIKQ